MNKRLRVRYIIFGGIGLAAIIAGFILGNTIIVLFGLFGLLTTLRFTQLDRWKDPEQRETYLPTYNKEWGYKDVQPRYRVYTSRFKSNWISGEPNDQTPGNKPDKRA